MEEFTVTPWEVEGTIDYGRLVEKFGTKEIDEKLKEEIKSIAGELHVLLRRDFFYSHRDLDVALARWRKDKGIFLYTGRGPSGKMHIGHLIPFIFTKWLQDVLDVNLYIQITDDEKYLVKERSWEEIKKYREENVLDIIALGFDPDKTFIFYNSEYVGNYYGLAVKIAKEINFSTAKAVFGFTNQSNIGIIFYPSLQIAPTFFEKDKISLIPCAIDQDPYFRLQRDVAAKLRLNKASLIHSKFLPPLTGMQGKMSSSKEYAIWLDDPPEVVRKKIMKYAFSGGQPTIEEHRKKGGNPDIDVSFQYLKILFEEDDEKLKEIEEEYRSGNLLTGELKNYTVEKINAFLEEFRANREERKEMIKEYMYDGKLAREMWERKFE